MSLDIYKKQFADLVSTASKECYKEIYAETGDLQIFSADFIFENLEKPKDPKMGRFAFPVFRYSKLLKSKPPDISKAISSFITNTDDIKVVATGGFLNVQINPAVEAQNVLTAILKEENNYGNAIVENQQPVLVEYSSVNIAKPFGIAHLRTTILGASLSEIYKKLGYNVIRLNYLGDWGTNQGEIIEAFRKWGDERRLKNDGINYLVELYVQFNEAKKKDSTLRDDARSTFKKLEN